MPKVTIDGKTIEVADGTTILKCSPPDRRRPRAARHVLLFLAERLRAANAALAW
jgi:hypothetical protein